MRHLRIALCGISVVLTAALAPGCGNGPPGGGITNGPAPDLTSDKQSFRTDETDKPRTGLGEMKGAAGTSDLTGGGGTNSGTGGKGGGAGGNAPAKTPEPRTGDARKDTIQAVGSAGAMPPATKEGTAPGSAAGGTKPAGDIKVGTPRSPQ